MGLLTTNPNRVFLGISNGKITRKTGQDTPPEIFTAVEGLLTGINRRNVDINGQQTEFIDFIMRDDGDVYQVSTQLSGSIARSIILCLASVESFVGRQVRFSPYLSKDGQHTNVIVEVAGQRVGWVTRDIPPAKEIRIGSTVVKDDSQRLAFINRLVDQISMRLLLVEATPQALVQGVEDLPADDSYVNDGNIHM